MATLTESPLSSKGKIKQTTHPSIHLILLFTSGGLKHLIKALGHEDDKVLEVSLRSLKNIFQSPRAPRDLIFTHPAFERLLLLLRHPTRAFGEDVATIIARCCCTKHHQEVLLKAGALEGLAKLMTSSIQSNQAAALDALVSLSKDNPDVCEALMNQSGTEEQLLSFTRDPRSQFRFLASSILTQINCNLPKTPKPPLAFREQKHVLQVLVKLLREPTVNHQVAEILALLTEEREDLQRAAYEADAAKTLCGFLKDPNLMDDSLRHGVLKALGTICRDLAACREQIIKLNATQEIVRSLESESTEVISAAAVCIMNMTRTIKDLNSTWLRSSVAPLLALLEHESNEVKATACGALCNLLMDAECAKEVCVPESLRLLVELTQSQDSALMSNAVWAFKNLSCDLPDSLRTVVLQELHWSYVKALVYNPNHDVQESALRFLQNMCCNSNNSFIQYVISWSSNELLLVIHEKLHQPMDSHPEVIVAALKVTSNISTALPEHQLAVMDSGIPGRLIPCLRDERSQDVRAAAVWCVINLTWMEQGQSNSTQDDARIRAMTLRELGVEAELKQMQSDESLNIRERVKTALGFFQRLEL
eukprot:g9060.t1